jgi:hypothetical protein
MQIAGAALQVQGGDTDLELAAKCALHGLHFVCWLKGSDYTTTTSTAPEHDTNSVHTSSML